MLPSLALEREAPDLRRVPFDSMYVVQIPLDSMYVARGNIPDNLRQKSLELELQWLADAMD